MARFCPKPGRFVDFPNRQLLTLPSFVIPVLDLCHALKGTAKANTTLFLPNTRGVLTNNNYQTIHLPSPLTPHDSPFSFHRRNIQRLILCHRHPKHRLSGFIPRKLLCPW